MEQCQAQTPNGQGTRIENKGIGLMTLKEAQKIIEGAISKAESLGIKMAICVVDSQADLVASVRMDGVQAYVLDNVRGKAMVSALYKIPSGDLAEKAAMPEFSTMNYKYGGRLLFRKGGIPIVIDGELIGAAAAGGGRGEQDEEVAKAGIAEISLRLPRGAN